MGQKGTPGASLRMWAKFFPNASIQGVDIDSKILFSEERITTGLVDQLNRSSIQNFLKTQGKTYDLIIDDGLHSKDSIINTIEESIPFLAPEGYLIVEDVDNNLIIELLKCAAGIPDVTGFFVLFRETTGRTRTGYLYVLQHKPSLIETQLGSEHR
jgi:hypothetical protein